MREINDCGGSTLKRIEFIDCAKGICIILVVYHHAVSYVGTSLPFDHILQCFRMPLYFMLSGLFFKPYNNYIEFLVKKLNRLLIPFLFFFCFTSILLPFILTGGTINIRVIAKTLIIEDFFNLPIWFLLCLFNTNLLYYAIIYLFKRYNYKSFYVGMTCVGLGFVSYMLGNNGINLPFYIDTSIASLPFFFCGHLLKRFFLFMSGQALDRLRLINLSLLITIMLVLYVYAKPINFESNNYSDTSFLLFCICGVLGTILVFMLSKILYMLPIMHYINYLGKYSIITLCTHILFVGPFSKLLGLYIPSDWLKLIIIVAITCILEITIIVPLFRKYLPYFTAQKDLIKYTV